MPERKLRRITEDSHKWVGGVCSGIAYWFGIEAWIVRLVLACLIFFHGVGLIPYILLWIFMPKWEKTPDDFNTVTGA